MWYLLRKWKRKALEKQFGEEEPITNITQKELNRLYENPDIAISYKYSYIVKTFLMSAFYLPLFPLGALISLIGIILMYLIEKFNLLNTYKRPDMLNSQICVFYIKNFKFLIFTTALGNRIFLFNMWEINKFSVISITIFSILLIIPYHRFFKWKCLGVKETDVLKKSYMDCYFDFSIDYERQNPITKKKGNHIYLERLMEEGIITQEMFLDLSQKLDSENVNIMELYYRRSANVQTKLKESVAQMFKIRTMRTRAKTKINFAQDLFNQDNGDLKTSDKKRNKKTRALENLVISILPQGFVFNNIGPKKKELENEKNNIHIKTEQSEGKNKKINLFEKYKDNNKKGKNEHENNNNNNNSNSENPFAYSNNNHVNSQELIFLEKEKKNYLNNNNYPELDKIENHENYENTAFSGININNIIVNNYQVPNTHSDSPIHDNQIELYRSDGQGKNGQEVIEYSSPANLNYIDGQRNNNNNNLPEKYYSNQN